MIIKGGAGTGKTLLASLMIIEFLLVGKSALMTAVTETGAKQLAVRFIEELSCYQEQEGLLHIMDQLERIRNISRLKVDHDAKVHIIGLIEEKLMPLIRAYEEKRKKIRPLFFNSLVTQDQYFAMDPSLRGHCFNTRVIFNILKQTNYQESIWEVLKNVSKMADKVVVGEEWKVLYIIAVERSIEETNVVITNTAKAADINRCQPSGMRFQPELAVFDEAAHSTLADAYCVLSLDIKRLFLMGDSMQLTKDIRGDHDVLRISLLDLMEPLENKKNIITLF